MFGIIDVNNCYASIEALFDPSLRGKPLCVASNNDGCVVARSPEAKALGIKMAEPVHEVRSRCPQVLFRSSNYELYADMSSRVMRIIDSMVPALEIYSIDEAFISMTGIVDRAGLAHQIRDRIRTWLGLPVCVGIGSSKTRAKLSNFIAKKGPKYGGVFDIDRLAPAEQSEVMDGIAVEEGVGRRRAHSGEARKAGHHHGSAAAGCGSGMDPAAQQRRSAAYRRGATRPLVPAARARADSQKADRCFTIVWAVGDVVTPTSRSDRDLCEPGGRKAAP